MSTKYQLIQNFQGYRSKADPTNQSAKYLVRGSKNVLINDQEKVGTRGGYTILGATSTDRTPIESSYDWLTSANTELSLRSYDEFLEVYVGTVEGRDFNAWHTVEDSFTAVDFCFAPWWDNTEKIDVLLFVNGTTTLFNWSGALTTYASATSNTITKEGSGTWANARFLTSGTRQIRIKDSGGTWRTFTYTGGESTTTLTGVSPDPTSFTFTAGALVMQEVRTNTNTPAATFSSDTIKVKDNQVYVGSNTSKLVYISKNSSFSDFTFSSPRITGEGALLTLDSSGAKFGILQDEMIIFAGQDHIYRTKFEQITVSTTLSETLQVKKLKTARRQSALHQDLIEEVGDYLAFITHDKELRIIGSVENLEGFQIQNYSDPIKTDFDAETFTNGHMKFAKNRLHIATPTNDNLYILQFVQDENGATKKYWQPPQTIPARRIAVISGDVHFHSSRVPESYKLFNGTNDNDNPMNAVAKFSYQQFGDRVNLKRFNEHYTEGYISANTELTARYYYEYTGSGQTLEKVIIGSDENITFETLIDPSLGNEALGDVSFSGDIIDDEANMSKFRVIHTLQKSDFYEVQVEYSSDQIDAQWEILAYGPSAELSVSKPIKIKQ